MKVIPIIDLDNLIKEKKHHKIVSELETTFSTIGIAFLINHHIPEYILNNAFSASKKFHELKYEDKIKYETKNKFSGYIPMSRERLITKSGKIRKPNQSDSFIINNRPSICELNQWKNHIFCGKQIWPDHLVNFKKNVSDYYQSLQQLCIKLLSPFSIVMGCDPNYLKQFFNDPSITLRLLYYPPFSDSNLYGINPHSDYGCFTLLQQDKIGGLQVQYHDSWIDVPVLKNTLILNLGNIMSIWSNGYLKACFHRVINKSKQGRYSIPFFYDCNLDAIIGPLINRSHSSEYNKPIIHGEYIENIIKSIYTFDKMEK